MTGRKQDGFTLVELMIVIAILGVLVALAIPAYLDFTIRTKNSECLSAASSAKLSVGETLHTTSTFSSEATGYRFTSSDYCESVVVSNTGIIIATTHNTGADVPATFQLEPSSEAGRISWTCTELAGVPAAQLPSECR